MSGAARESTTGAAPLPGLPALFRDNLDILMCPACGGRLELAAAAANVSGDAGRDAPRERPARTPPREALRCASCGRVYPSEAGIPLLFWPHHDDGSGRDVTEKVKSFYEENPFPNYDDLDSTQRLREKAEKGVFARLLDEQVEPGARILEVGCGTGQLTNFLGTVWGRTVFGTDICLNSLALGERFRERYGVDRCAFLQMNLFRPVFRPESFSLVIANGVLHHTADPFGGFRSISKLVRKGGHVIVGLYNTYGRLFTDLRRLLFRLSGDRLTFLDPYLRDATIGAVKKHAWFMDQYKHPHESTHTLGEVLGWFEQTDFEFVNSIPKATAFAKFAPDEALFEAKDRGTKLDHGLVQLGMVLRGGSEGGFFLVIGRRT